MLITKFSPKKSKHFHVSCTYTGGLAVNIDESQLELVKRAMSGHNDSLNQLAESIVAPLRSYVLRATYKEEITDDIVQETLLEMFRIFQQLRRADQFWPWLCKIALNKIRRHSNMQNRQRELLESNTERVITKIPNMDGLAEAINREFQEAITQSLSFLSDRQRAVLSMRCYDNMPYSQIAEIMDISELGCRLLFVRARKKLQHKLSSFGYGQKFLLLALALVGKLTAPSEAAAAQICLSPSVLSAGGVAAGIAFVTSKAGLLTIAAGGVLVAGTVTLTQEPTRQEAQITIPENYFVSVTGQSSTDSHFDEGYYFFPQGKQGTVLTRFTAHQDQAIVQILQNDTGNYAFDAQRQTAAIHNYHYWNPDLSVMTLPTDSTELEAFLAQMENRPPHPRNIKTDSANLFIKTSDDRQPPLFGVRNYDALMEERFQYNRPAGTVLIDNRDGLHQQKWCRVKIEGRFHDTIIRGDGRLPFVYSAALLQPAWIKLDIVNEMTIIDTPEGAAVLKADRSATRYPSGTFLCGFNKPWAGLHVIDTVRRDAAQFQIPFKTYLDAHSQKALVSLSVSSGQIQYVIDMNRDLIEKIIFFDVDTQPVGEITFEYLGIDEFSSNDFTPARLPYGSGSSKTEPIHWLSELMAEGFSPETKTTR